MVRTRVQSIEIKIRNYEDEFIAIGAKFDLTAPSLGEVTCREHRMLMHLLKVGKYICEHPDELGETFTWKKSSS